MPVTSEGVRVIAAEPAEGAVRYSIATLVNDLVQYGEMLASFRARGFDGPDCEFLCIDNSERNAATAYDGLNRLLAEARGTYVVLCHQDVRLIGHGRTDLDCCLAELDRLDPAWALAGNAGGVAPGRLALRITDGHGRNQHVGRLPELVSSLDENFIVVRASARLSLSANLAGFHFYGADLCLVADVLGHRAYVIDFHLHHLSPGAAGAAFHACQDAFRAKWARALRPRWIQTTCALVFVAGTPVTHSVGGLGQRLAARISRKLPGARGWADRSAADPAAAAP